MALKDKLKQNRRQKEITESPFFGMKNKVISEIRKEVIKFKGEIAKKLMEILKKEVSDDKLRAIIKEIIGEGRIVTLLDELTPKKGKDFFDGKRGERGKQGLPGIPGIPGIGAQGLPGEGGKDGSLEKPSEMVNKINKSTVKIKPSLIEGLEEKFTLFREAINKRVRPSGGGGGMGAPVTFSFSGDGATTSFTLPNNVAGGGLAIWAYYNGQWIQPNVHFTVVGKTFATTFTPEADTTIEGFLLRK